MCCLVTRQHKLLKHEEQHWDATRWAVMFPSDTVCLDTTPADITRVHKYNGEKKASKFL